MTHAELESFVHRFEDCTLPRELWTHRAHLSVALWYLIHYPREEATNRIRTGIQRYNQSLGNTSGYHETITLSWIAILAAFLKESPTNRSLEELAKEASERFGASDYLLKHFTREQLFSDIAAKEWIEPDLAPIG
ncbi:MAG: hypothetical protein ACKVP0_01835 [Pirellulaceae bacterium]